MSEKQLENLRLGREKSAANRAAKKSEREAIVSEATQKK